MRFSVMPCRSVYPPCPTPPAVTLFDSLFTLFTRHFHSLNLLLPLLVFVFTSHSHASCCYCLSYFLPTLFNWPLAFFFSRPLAFVHHRCSLSSSFFILHCSCLHTCTYVGAGVRAETHTGGMSTDMSTSTNLQ